MKILSKKIALPLHQNLKAFFLLCCNKPAGYLPYSPSDWLLMVIFIDP